MAQTSKLSSPITCKWLNEIETRSASAVTPYDTTRDSIRYTSINAVNGRSKADEMASLV